MASGTSWKWVLAAVLAAGAGWNGGCKDDNSSSGSGGSGAVNTPLLWTSTASGPNSTAGAGGVTPLNWIDPNTVVNSGGGGVVNSTDERTWDRPTIYLSQPDPEAPHPLSTLTSNGNVTNPEDLLASFINAYRQQVLGVGAGGIIGGIPIGGGGFQNVLLPMDTPIRKSVRAHCKHIAAFHPGALTIGSPSGDTFFGGGVTPVGRTAKCKIAPGNAWAAVASGPNYPDASSASNYFIGLGQAAAGWTHLGTGHWLGFSEQYYWGLMFATNPALVP